MNNLTVIEHNGIRVLTTQQLAEVYETDVNNIQKNFSNNRDRFAAGRDYYLLQGDELNEFKRVLNNIQEPMKFVSQLMLWTERGANRHSKILDTDKAWQQFDLLEETYFGAKQGTPTLPKMTQLQVIAAIAQNAADQEQKILALTERQENTERTLQLVKDTFAKRDGDNWRDGIKRAIAKIVKVAGMDFQTVNSEAYQLLEERARCDLATRLRNLKFRLSETGATKTAVDKLNKMDVIQQDARLKEIYTTIVKEMTIRYVA